MAEGRGDCRFRSVRLSRPTQGGRGRGSLCFLKGDGGGGVGSGVCSTRGGGEADKSFRVQNLGLNTKDTHTSQGMPLKCMGDVS